MKKITDTLHEDLCTFMIVTRLIILRIRNVSEKVVKTKTCTIYAIICFQQACHFSYNVEKYSRGGEVADDNIVWRMRIACWITRAKNTYSE